MTIQIGFIALLRACAVQIIKYFDQEAEIRGTQSNHPGPSTNQTYSLSRNAQPVLLSFRQLQAGYLTCIEEVNK